MERWRIYREGRKNPRATRVDLIGCKDMSLKVCKYKTKIQKTCFSKPNPTSFCLVRLGEVTEK